MILLFKLLMTPVFIAGVSLAGRRWGPAVSGLLMGLPLTSGPISFILAVQYGPQFASQAAIGNILGQASVCVFCLVYSLVAQRTRWPVSCVIAIGAFLLATSVWNHFSLALLPAFAILALVILLILRLIPRYSVPVQTSGVPKWDLPLRMILATTFVLLLTTFAGLLGPQLSGLLSPFPVFGTVLAAFTHHQQGPGAAATLLRGVVFGSWAFGCFFLVVSALLPTLGLAWTYLLATLVALTADGLGFYLSR